MRYLSRLILALSVSVLLSACLSLEELAQELRFGGSHVVTEGRNVHLYDIRNGALVQRGVEAIPASGLLPGHQIFGGVQHPTKPWFFVSSLNECDSGNDWCWGNARIDRFVVSAAGFKWAGVVYEFLPGNPGMVPDCANEDSGVVGQSGNCAPVGITLNADATRLYAQEDDNDDVLTFDLASNGEATFLSEGDSVDLHGLAVHPDQAHLYNGSNVYDITGDTAVNVFSGTGGNATQFAPYSGGVRLMTTEGTNLIDAFDISNPINPVALNSINLGSNRARDFAMNRAGTALVGVGRNSVASVGFDGNVFTPIHQLILSKPLTIENRGVALNSDATSAVVAWFTQPGGGPRAGGATVYSIASDGHLTEQGSIDFTEECRVVKELVAP